MIKPRRDYILIELIEHNLEDDKTKGGIILPEVVTNNQIRFSVGKIVAKGQGRKLDDGTYVPIDLNLGDRILFTKNSGTPFKDGQLEGILLQEHNVIATL
jgi:chaperonin GroES